jgi:CSLREA domain-containing protein
VTSTTATDAQGRYRFDFVPLGEYELETSDRPLPSSSGSGGGSGGGISVPRDSSLASLGERAYTQISLTATTRVVTADLQYLGKGEVTGTVLAPQGGGDLAPVGSAVVSLQSESLFGGTAVVVANGAGRFEIRGVFAGPFSLQARDPVSGLGGSTSGQALADGQTDLQIILAPAGSIAGTVFEADGETPVEDALVRLQDGRYARTDAAGGYRFEAIPLGSYQIDVTGPSSNGALPDRASAVAVVTEAGEEVRADISLTGTGTVRVLVADYDGSPAPRVQVTLASAAFSREARGRTDDTGVATFRGVLAGSFTASALDAQGLLGGSTSGSIEPGGTEDVTVTLEASGTIRGVATEATDTGPAPVEGLVIRLSGTDRNGNLVSLGRTTVTNREGEFRFDLIPLARSPFSLEFTDSGGAVRAEVAGIELTTQGQIVDLDVTALSTGTVRGLIRNPDGSPAPGAAVQVASDVAGFQTRFLTSDAAGEYSIGGVPVGTVRVFASQPAARYGGTAAGSLEAGAAELVLDVLMLADQVPQQTGTLRNYLDANGFSWPVQSDGSIVDGTRNVFLGNGVVLRGGMRLEVIGSGVAVPFIGRGAGLQLDTRQLAIPSDPLGDLEVERRVYVPQRGFFARYLEVLHNRGTEPITVGLRLDSHYQWSGAGAVVFPPRELLTSSGDQIAEDSDRWVVIGDGRGSDPFETTVLPPVAQVFGDDDAAIHAAKVLFESVDASRDDRWGRLRVEWTDLTIPAGETAIVMHFAAQQTGSAPAIATASCLSRLPDEALQGISTEDRARIVNFSIADADGLCSPALPALDGVVRGVIRDADGTTPVPGATVTFQSEHPIFQRRWTTTTDADGAYGLSSYFASPPGTALIPVYDYQIDARHPQSNRVTEPVPSAFDEGGESVADVSFDAYAVLRGTVRRLVDDALVVVPGADVLLSGPGLEISSVRTDGEGSYRVGGLPAGSYTITARLALPSGTALQASATGVAAEGSVRNVDLTLPDAYEVAGSVTTGNGQPASNVRVRIEATGFAREVRTDSGGAYRFEDVPNGSFAVRAIEPRTGLVSEALVTVAGDAVAVTPLQLAAVGSLLVQARFTDGSVAANASVVLDSAAYTGPRAVGRTGVDGRLFLPAVPAGAFTVSVTNPLSLTKTGSTAGSIDGEGDAALADVSVDQDSAPGVVLTSPVPGTRVGEGTPVLFAADAEDDVGVASVRFEAGTGTVTDTSAPYSAELVPPLPAVGEEVVVRAVARDTAGNETRSAPVTIFVDRDQGPPTVTLSRTQPPAGTDVYEGDTVSFEAIATDDVGVARVEFLRDGTVFASDASAPYAASFAIPSESIASGEQAFAFAARAFDRKGNATTADLVVPVRNDEPPTVQISAPTSAPRGEPILVTAAASDDRGVVRVEFFADGQPIGSDMSGPNYSISYTASTTAPSVALTVRAVDGKGQVSADSVSVVNLSADTTPPQIVTGQPSSVREGSSFELTPRAIDASPLARAELRGFGTTIQGQLVFAVSEEGLIYSTYSFEYAVPLGYAGGEDRVETVTLEFEDGFGNVASTAWQVTVIADRLPAIDLTAPLEGGLIGVGDTLVLRADATDDLAGVSVRFYVDGELVHTDPQAPFEASFVVPEGRSELVVEAEAIDRVGQSSGRTTPVRVNVGEFGALVVNTADDEDDGACDATHCSLREAIQAANANPGLDSVRFDILGAGVHTIQPTTELPEITDPVEIDARSQPGYSGTPLIELDGQLVPSFSYGLLVTAGPSTIAGFAINRFQGVAIRVGGVTASGTTIIANAIGTDPSGEIALGNFAGVEIWDASECRVGGGRPGEQNTIAASLTTEVFDSEWGSRIQGNRIGVNTGGTTVLRHPDWVESEYIQNEYGISGGAIIGTDGDGVDDQGEGNLVAGRYTGISGRIVAGNTVGLDASGSRVLPGQHTGISVGSDARIGTNGDGISDEYESNVVGGSSGDGISVALGGNWASSGTVIAGNRVGVSRNGSHAVPNNVGIDVYTIRAPVRIGTDQNGAGDAVEANYIRHNASHGIKVAAYSSFAETLIRIDGNEIGANGGDAIVVTGGSDPRTHVTRNRIRDNDGLGIDLGDDGIDGNDVGDSDGGPNRRQNYPSIELDGNTSSGVIRGVLDSTPSSVFTIEVFANESCDRAGFGEGEVFIGDARVATDGSGRGEFEVVATDPSLAQQPLTATATDSAGRTSEFSRCTDADYDGVSDALEAPWGSAGDPMRFDSDEDGASDGHERFVLGTVPLVADTDGDGLPDGYEEILFGTDPLTSDAADADCNLNSVPDHIDIGIDPSADCDADGVLDACRVSGGLRAHYHGNAVLSQLIGVRPEGPIDADWGFENPQPRLPADSFSVRWSGEISAEFAEPYVFHVTADDGVRLWLDGELLLDGWRSQPRSERSTSPRVLEAGRSYPLVLEYFDSALEAGVQLAWSSASTPKQIIPASRMRFTPFRDDDADGVPDSCDTSDRDGDGLSDSEEAILGTNPDDPDSDRDGLGDGEEIRDFGTNPLASDTDGDGLDDANELRLHGTDPLVPDADRADCNQNAVPDASDIASSTSADCDANAIPDECRIRGGLTGTYFENPELNGALLLERADGPIRFQWGQGPPGPGVESDSFSVRWVGEIEPEFSETYTFSAQWNEGLRLWVDGDLVIDGVGTIQSLSGSIALAAGRRTAIVLEYFEGTGDAHVELRWRSPSTPEQVIPASRFLYAPFTDRNANLSPDACDVAAGAAADCDGDGILDSFELDTGAEVDRNANDVLDRCDIADGTSTDVDANGVVDDAQLDCDANGAPDVVEIASGAEVDADANGIVDACETFEFRRDVTVTHQSGLTVARIGDAAGGRAGNEVVVASRTGAALFYSANQTDLVEWSGFLPATSLDHPFGIAIGPKIHVYDDYEYLETERAVYLGTASAGVLWRPWDNFFGGLYWTGPWDEVWSIEIGEADGLAPRPEIYSASRTGTVWGVTCCDHIVDYVNGAYDYYAWSRFALSSAIGVPSSESGRVMILGVADTDGVPGKEVVTYSDQGIIDVWEVSRRGYPYWDGEFENRAHRRFRTEREDRFTKRGALADLDGDSVAEIVFATAGGVVSGLRFEDGAYREIFRYGTGLDIFVVDAGDIDQDGTPEVALGDFLGDVWLLDTATGALRNVRPPDGTPAFVTVGDALNVGTDQLIVVPDGGSEFELYRRE